MPLVDERDTSLGAKSALQQQYTKLYDPPVDGLTPLDGNGDPRASVIHAPDVAGKLKAGFTTEPLIATMEPEEEEKPKRASKRSS